MKIDAINVYQVDLPLREGRYAWADGKYVDVFDSTVVEIAADDGTCGYGEVCPLGPFYLPAYGPGARTGIAELAPHLLGADPTQLGLINDIMDRALLGHAYVKSPLDMACWDLLGKTAGLPVCDLLGGRFGERVVLYRAISQYTRFQLKVGGDVADDIQRIRAARETLDRGEVLVADANTGWLQHEAARVVDAVADLDVYIEQPCRGYEASLSVRRRTRRPFVLDENIDSLEALLRAHRRRHGCRQPENFQARRLEQDATVTRPVCLAGDCHDPGRQLGRGYRDCRDRPPRPLHAGGFPLHGNGLQQLRDRAQR